MTGRRPTVLTDYVARLERPLPGHLDYATGLVEGVDAHLDRIDELIGSYAEGWTIDRMPVVDRNLARIAVYELLYVDEIDDAVAITEAVELAKQMSTDDSPRFLNGLLGRIAEYATQLESLRARRRPAAVAHSGRSATRSRHADLAAARRERSRPWAASPRSAERAGLATRVADGDRGAPLVPRTRPSGRRRPATRLTRCSRCPPRRPRRAGPRRRAAQRSGGRWQTHAGDRRRSRSDARAERAPKARKRPPGVPSRGPSRVRADQLAKNARGSATSTPCSLRRSIRPDGDASYTIASARRSSARMESTRPL